MARSTNQSSGSVRSEVFSGKTLALEYISDENDNIDTYKAEKEANLIADKSGIKILRGKNLTLVSLDDKQNVNGALWTELDGNEFSFDIAVAETSRGKGIGSQLVNKAMSEFNSINEDGSFTYKLDVVSKDMESILIKKGFKITGRENGHTFMTK